MTREGVLQVARPRLPPTAELVPYLREIDAGRRYTNHGPLGNRLEARLAARFGVPEGGVALVSSGTAGLAAALAAAARPGGGLCALPAWTFPGTAHAVRCAGHVPWFVDIDRRSWTLTPEGLKAALGRAPGPLAAVVPVVPFGAPFGLAPWAEFENATGIPVVVDAAASFDTLRPAAVPAVLSLHATKILGVGEGGAVVSTDPARIRRVRQAANFGFYGSRVAEIPGTNAKLSEYHAAVGLAALDRWEETRAAWMAAAALYRARLEPLAGLSLQPGFGADWVSSTCMIRLSTPERDAVAALLAEAGIETRAWWGDGPSEHPAFRDCPRGDLPDTSWLAPRVLGLPFAIDMHEGEIARVARALERAAQA